MSSAVTFNVEGMQSQACAARLEKALASQPGVEELSVSFDKGQARVVYDPGITNVNRLDAAIREAGFITPPGCP